MGEAKQREDAGERRPLNDSGWENVLTYREEWKREEEGGRQAGKGAQAEGKWGGP